MLNMSSVDQLKEHLKKMSTQEKKDFAKACSTTIGNLNQIVYVNGKCGAALAIRIDKASAGKVSCDLLCPDADFEYVRSRALSA